jgi:hypothetical protein
VHSKRGASRNLGEIITETSRLFYFTITTDGIARMPIRYREYPDGVPPAATNRKEQTRHPRQTKGRFKLGVGFRTIGLCICTNAMTVLRHYALIYQANLISHIHDVRTVTDIGTSSNAEQSKLPRISHLISRRAAIPPYSALEEPPLVPKLYPTPSTSLGFANLIRARPSSHGAAMVAAR